MVSNFRVCFLVAALYVGSVSSFFVSHTIIPRQFALRAKNSKKRTAGKGFGEVAPPPAKKAPPPQVVSEPVLQSVDTGGSTAIPQVEDDGRTAEQRGKDILREKYGMRSLEEQQMEELKLERQREQQKKLQEWKRLADEGKDFDMMAMLPAPVLMAIDRFLKGGLVVSGLLFILAGIGICIEAWSKASGEVLPENVDNFIVQVIEPNFTPGLLVLLGFSVSLGLFASAQMSSEGAQYREGK